MLDGKAYKEHFPDDPARAYGHCAPVSIQAWINSPSSACEPGAGSRPSLGCQPQATKSCAR